MLVALIWFYVLALGLLAGAVINALRYELHDTGTLRGMTGSSHSYRRTGGSRRANGYRRTGKARRSSTTRAREEPLPERAD